MISALANKLPPSWEPEFANVGDYGGAESLLAPVHGKSSSVLLQATAVALYALVLVWLATFTLRHAEPVVEEPLELVMLPPEPELPALEEPPPPIEESQEEPPPPPIAEEPEPVAPVEPKPVIPEKKPIPVKKKIADKPPAQEPHRPATATPSPGTSSAPATNAIPSGYANQIFARVSRTASTTTARAAIARGQSGRVGYRLVIGPTGQLISKSISPSGNPAFDLAAAEALARAAPFPPTGVSRPISLSGAIVYR